MYDNETEAIFAIAVSSKSTAKPWIVEYVKNIIHELGYGELKIAIKGESVRPGKRIAGVT